MTDLLRDVFDMPRSVLPHLDLLVRDEQGCSLLHTAARNGYAALVLLLLSQTETFDVNDVDKFGRTALHFACMNNVPDVVVCLIKNGASIDKADISGRTAFLYSCLSGNLNMARWLAQQGCSIHHISSSQNSALHMACAVGDIDIVKWLVENGVQSVHPNDCGLTPALLAYHNGHNDIVNYLVGHTKSIRPSGPMKKSMVEHSNLGIFD